MNGAARQKGLSLVELVISVVVLGIAVAAVLSVYTNSLTRSADPQIRYQAVAIAQAYLDEILLRSFTDPDNGAVCGAQEASRDLYDNVCDYDGLSGAPADQTGTPIAGLSVYTVAVQVTQPGDLPGVGAANELRVTVTVSHSGIGDVVLNGYRTNY